MRAELQWRTRELENKCYKTILGIYANRITIDAVRDSVDQVTGPLEDLIRTVKKRHAVEMITDTSEEPSILLLPIRRGTKLTKRRGRQRKNRGSTVSLTGTGRSFTESDIGTQQWLIEGARQVPSDAATTPDHETDDIDDDDDDDDEFTGLRVLLDVNYLCYVCAPFILLSICHLFQ